LLAGLRDAPALAHADLFNAWMALAGIGVAPVATRDPKVWGGVGLGEAKSAISCSSVLP
jgi:hypothetical protein